ncbi:unnamed protein product [Parajaminaea phylloscopi]
MSSAIKGPPAIIATPPPAPAGLLGNPFLVRYLRALESNPLGTKQITAGILSALAEVLAGRLAGIPTATPKAASSPSGPLSSLQAILASVGINDRALKMFVYGWAISAPMGHVLVGALQKAFAGRNSAKDKIAQIIVSQLTVTVISNVVYLSCMAIVNGARSLDKIHAVLKAGLWRMLQISWLTSPAALAFAQGYLPPPLWEPFFTLLRFFMGVYFNTMAKRKQVALAKREALKKDAQGEKDTGDEGIRRKAEGSA